MKKGKAVATVANRFRAVGMDRRLSRRYILSEIEDASKVLIEQKVNDGTLQVTSLYQPINCVEMIQVDPITCPELELRSCKIVMRTKEKLPIPLYSRFGPMIKEVTTVDRGKVFERVTYQKYRRLKNLSRGYKKNKLFYIFSEGYIYIMDTEVYKINLEIATFDDETVSQLNSCESNECESGWDKELMIPEYLVATVNNMAAQAVSINRQIPIDDKPNMKENE